MKAMILAAGYGTRLRPVTYTMPKPLVPVCNQPLIGWAIEAFLRAGVDDLVINLHHLPELLERWVRDRYSDKAKLHFSFEPEILGTGGGIRKVREQLETEEDFFLVNGDTIQFPDYEALRKGRRDHDALAALMLRHPPEGDRFTAVWHDGGLITGFGNGSGEALMFSGAHNISTRMFDYLPEKAFSGIVDEVYMPVLADGREKVAAVVDDGLWFDIGTPQRYVSAAKSLVQLMATNQLQTPHGSRVHGDSVIHNTSSPHGTLTRSSIGERTTVSGDVRDSYIWNDCFIAGSVVLERCIVGHGVELTRPMELRDALITVDDGQIPRDAGYERVDGLVISWI
jgi:mannose-1-phosphate guanylyltransferase